MSKKPNERELMRKVGDDAAVSESSVQSRPDGPGIDRAEFEQMLLELSSAFAHLRAEQLDIEIGKWLQRIGEFLQLDMNVIWQPCPDGQHLNVSHCWTVSGSVIFPNIVSIADIPWLAGKLGHGETVVCHRIDDLPAEADKEKKILRDRGVKSVAGIPLSVGGINVGAVNFGTLSDEREWPDYLLRRLQLVAEIFAGALLRRTTLEAVRNERDRAQQYLDMAGTILIALDRGGCVTMINQRGCELLGYTESELIGKEWFGNFLPKHIAREVRSTFDPLMRGEKQPAEYYENSVLTKSSEERLIAWNNRLLHDGSGRIIGTLSSGEDITERRQMLRELRKSKERFERVAQQSREMVWEVDADGLFTYVSPASEAILGYRPEEMVGKMHFYDLQPTAEREKFKAASFRQITNRESFRNDVNQAETKSGRIVWFLTSGAPVLDDQGKFTGYIGSDLDITERVQMEERLKVEREELTEKNIALKQVLDHIERERASFRHDISSGVENLLKPIVEKLKKKRWPVKGTRDRHNGRRH